MCSAAATGRLIDWSGRASIFPVPQSRCRAIDLNVFSSTVLPTPRSPVSTMLRSGRPRAIALEHHLELADLPVPAGELRRPLASAWSVGIAHRVHAIGLYGQI